MIKKTSTLLLSIFLSLFFLLVSNSNYVYAAECATSGSGNIAVKTEDDILAPLSDAGGQSTLILTGDTYFLEIPNLLDGQEYTVTFVGGSFTETFIADVDESGIAIFELSLPNSFLVEGAEFVLLVNTDSSVTCANEFVYVEFGLDEEISEEIDDTTEEASGDEYQCSPDQVTVLDSYIAEGIAVEQDLTDDDRYINYFYYELEFSDDVVGQEIAFTLTSDTGEVIYNTAQDVEDNDELFRMDVPAGLPDGAYTASFCGVDIELEVATGTNVVYTEDNCDIFVQDDGVGCCYTSDIRKIVDYCAQGYDAYTGPNATCACQPEGTVGLNSSENSQGIDDSFLVFNLDCSSGYWPTALGCVDFESPIDFVVNAYGFFLGTSGAIALILIAFASIRIMMSAGDPGQLQSSKDLLMSAISGLLMVILAAYLMRVIGVDILGIF